MTRHHKSDKHLVTLTVDPDGKGGTAKPGEITSTSAHLFWLPDAGKWVKAQQLKPGMWLQTSSGTWIQITAIDNSHRSERVHNLTVAGVHTYYALAGGHAGTRAQRQRKHALQCDSWACH
ncbi:polymorphic toxin-type HINT domain-containing protein [Streptomyces hypolithicus]